MLIRRMVPGEASKSRLSELFSTGPKMGGHSFHCFVSHLWNATPDVCASGQSD